jgi:methylmalonyl-CoA/ethylmalonyl-CoA epimerase
MKIDHIGIACLDIQKAKGKYLELGYVVTKDLITDFGRNLDYIFMKMDSITIELICKHDKSKESDIDNIIAQQKIIGNKMYHICYTSSNLEEDINRYKRLGYKLIKSPSVAVACDNKIVAFLIHLEMGIIELIEE